MKKTISILLIVMMVLSVGITGLLASAETVAPQAEGATTVNMSDITTAWADYIPKADDDASWEGWTAIGSYDDLVANFAKAVDGGKFYLTADIAIGSTHLPAANTVNKNFTFDGNGHSFTFTAGTSRSVFQMMSGATIQNLKLTGSFTSRSDNSRVDMAPLGSQTWGNNGGSIVLKNVYSDVAVTVTNIGQYKQAAGVISNVGDNSSFTDVVFAGSIKTANPNSEEAKIEDVAGIVGTASNNISFTNCYVNAQIKVVNDTVNFGWSNKDNQAGGFVGLIGTGTTFTNCATEGTLTIDEVAYYNKGGNASDKGYYYTHVGGFAGRARAATFTNCINGMDIVVTGNGAVTSLGGFVGWGSAGTAGLTFDSCTNSGNITVEKGARVYNPSANKTGIGGFVGVPASSITVKGTSANNGDISVNVNSIYVKDGAETTGNAIVGGIVGNLYVTADIKATNNGTITATSAAAGGIVGNVTAGTPSVKLAGSSNTATINGSNAAGIIGNSEVALGTISNVSNSGNITGGNNAGGVIARLCGAATFENCTNTGNIKDSYRAGGIVGWTKAAVTLTDCANSGSVVTTNSDGYSGVGGIVGYAEGLAKATGCTNSGSVSLSGNNSTGAGGVVGFAKGGLEATTCTNTGNVTTAHNGGGIAGRVNGNATFTGCVNGDSSKTAENNNVVTSSGSANNDKTGQGTLGGLAGYVTGNATIKGSSNYGKVINPKGTACFTAKFVGGLLAKADGSVTVGGAAEADACFNHGIVESATWCDGNTQYVGGLVGYAVSGSFENCTNNGSVTLTQGHGTIGGAAGIVGVSKSVTIKNCVNNGTISTTASKWAVAGMVGRVFSGDVVVTDCVNNGTISGANYAGGMVGILDSGVTSLNVTGCVNTGAVSITGGYDNAAAGMVARAGSPVTIKNCRNEGTITTTFTGGGMAGYLTGATTIENCVNGVEGDATKGVITGSAGSYIGGIGGAVDKATIKNSTNNASINGTGAFKIGGIVAQCGGSEISGCINNGDITFSGDRSGELSIGGISGDAVKVFKNNKNYGDISVSGSATGWISVGGLIGRGDTTIDTCENYGNLTVSAKSTGSDTGLLVGGFVGLVGANDVKDSINMSTISVTGTAKKEDGSNGHYGVGGFIGWTNGNHTFTNCQNTGTIISNGLNAGGFVGYVAEGKTLTGALVNNATVTGTNAGGIVGQAGSALTLTGATNNGVITGYNNAGGIIALANGGSFTNCTNTAAVTDSHRAGGIVGWTKAAITISGCSNSGAVTINSGDNWSGVGGILGYSQGAVTVDDCHNTGVIIGNGGNKKFGAGGILGYSEGTVTIKNSTNNANVTSVNYTGGIFGHTTKATTIQNCTNGTSTAKDAVLISNKVSGNSGARLGGIGGCVENTATFENCKNYAKIVNPAGWDKNAKFIGGIVGQVSGKVTIGASGDATKACFNYGTIEHNGSYNNNHCQPIGGIIGNAGGGADVYNAENHGNIELKAGTNNAPGGIGGIVGTSSATVNVKNSKNLGNITCTSDNVNFYVGGIVGRVWDGTVNVESCTNSGSVEGTAAGGILGYLDGGVANVKNSSTSGDVTATTYVGGVAGLTRNGGVFENVTVTADATITATGAVSGTPCLGGMIGRAYNAPTFTGCTMNGAVKAENWTGAGDAYIGGFVGHSNGGSYTNCTNGGSIAVTGSSKIGGIGGIVGRRNANITFTNCDNKAPISVDATSAFILDGNGWSEGIGGILGNGGGSATFTDCDNTGNITSNTDTAIGGIAGFTQDGAVTLTNCTNSGKLIGFSEIGGMVGVGKSVTINNCKNSGELDTSNTAGKDAYIGGIVGYVTGGSIKNCENTGKITLDTVPASSNTFAGGIAGYLNGTITVEKCTNNGEIVADNHWYFGGVVGTTSGNVTVKECVNNGTLKGLVNASWNVAIGGVVGYVSSGTLNVTDSDNTGSIIHTSGNGVNGHVGGIVGRVFGTATVTGCDNTGSIYAAEGASGFRSAAGIVGMLQNKSTLTITNCTNTAAITGNNFAAGIFADTWDGNKATVTISGCTNSGAIKASNAGGIFAYPDENSATISIDNCTNSGNITGGNVAGGIVGRARNTLTITNCTNTGTIKDAYRAGGIVGWINGNTTITNCTNGQSGTDKGSVTITSGDSWSGVGGILGYAQAGSVTIKGCTNYGALTSSRKGANENSNYGIGGIVGKSDVAVTIGGTAAADACVNYGTITANKPKYVGGILGYAAGKTLVTNCTNNGSILVNSSNNADGGWTFIGGVVGQITAADSKVSGCNNLANIEYKQDFCLIGGIVGQIAGNNVTIENCNNGSTAAAPHFKGTNGGWRNPMAGIVAHITGCTGANITGCTNYGTFELTGNAGNSTHIGGIVGLIQGSDATVSGCVNNANITKTSTNSESSIGGIVGSTRDVDGKTITITNCQNYGDLSGSTNVGGIFGGSWLGCSGATLYIDGCTNHGDISAKVYTGGIVGKFNAKVVITNCVNGSAEALDANVITALGSNSESYLGGIIAYAGGEANISNCVNYGKILNPAGTGFAKYVGGIAGGTASNATVVYNCGNKGTIVINGIHHNDHTQYVGGIVGYSVAGGRISYCYNDGAIQLNAKYADGKTTCGAAGAIVGVAGSGGKLVVDSCVNRSTITIAENITNNWAAGGVLGRTFSGCDVEIKNCVNDASAEINAILVGGIFGVADGGSKVAITNCQNRAVLTGNVVGGITSGDRGANAKITVDQCSNLGTIIGATEGAGILAHVSSGTTATITNSVNVANVLGQARYGIAPETATVTECGFPMNLGLNGGSLIANVIGIGDKNSAMMSYYKDHLEDYINQMDAYLEEVYKLPAKYDPFTIEDLEQALEYAKSVFNTEVWVLAQDADTNEWYAVILTQARVNEAYNKLVDARAAVLYADQKIELLDRTIADAKELYNTSDIYTAESWAVFTDALHAAQDLRAFGYTNEDGSVTAIEDLDVEIIRAYIAALRDSIKNLVLGGNIYSAEDFAKLEGQKGTFYLMNDIEISAPVANFSGKLIGNGYTITLNKTALFENVDGELAIADDSQIKYASISDVNIVGNANGAESLFGKAYGLVKVSNVLIDVEDVTSAALFNENEDNAEISVLYVITYSNTTDAALVSNLNNGKVEMHYVLAMTDAVALVSGNGTALAKVTYLNGVVFYDEFGVSYTDADVFASGRVAYEMNNAMAASTNAKIASTTLVQILGVDELPAVGNFTADGLNKVIKEKGTYVNASYLYSDSEIPGGDVVAPLAPIVSGLNSAIARAEALIADNYTEASWANMLKALEAAKKAVTSAKTQVGVDNARKALDIAVASLVKKLVVDTDNETGAVAGPDYTALNAAIEAAQALKYSDFTSETWSNLQTMLAMAKIAKRSTSQATIDSAVAALNGAVAGLVKAPAETDKTPVVKPTEPATEDGCGSVVGGAAVILTAVIALGAGISFKKKED